MRQAGKKVEAGRHGLQESGGQPSPLRQVSA